MSVKIHLGIFKALPYLFLKTVDGNKWLNETTAVGTLDVTMPSKEAHLLTWPS